MNYLIEKAVVKYPLSICLGMCWVLISTGCSTVSSPDHREKLRVLPEWVVFQAKNGQAIDWNTMSKRALASDIILVGEQHDNAIAHKLELKFVNELLTDYPNSAVAMEMFERNEQAFIDLYLDDRISTEALMETTNSQSWGGSDGNWQNWYQPIIDAVKERVPSGARLVAANSPRPYVKLARLEGYGVLTELASQDTEVYFVVPDISVDDNEYRERFNSLMTGHDHVDDSEVDSLKIDTDAYFRAQQLWDATMAEAVLSAHKKHPKVVLFIGDFHIANSGGTLQRIIHDNQELSVTTISILRKNDPQIFDPEDAARADFVIYTR
ncbi:ChaN family lipoprotein [Rubellicoccus peritrichatus]|uniref:ChaN family lipoprotein n=1 Tax=Rubellicoccus peritrichatus TaxID=3080537 RepID=A0AAQ3QSE5_9BACT|nr:ChaN family lipoprotein [Puniceicoccus sp. CR14]WOO42338.1 ChaN family lipoprotein [Puniceicoccus sp. CR14]